jgi:hypothetical protein
MPSYKIGSIPLFACALVFSSCAYDVGDVGAGTSGLIRTVPGEFTTIGAAIAASAPGDTIHVDPGEYVESVTLGERMRLEGAGPDQTILRGRVVLAGPTTHVSGLRITAVGAGLPSNAVGIEGDSQSTIITGNVIDGFDKGVRLFESGGAVTANVIQRNGIGIELFQTDPVEISNNLVLHNTRAGIRTEASTVPNVWHNTVIGNGFADGTNGAGIAIVTGGSEYVQNNICVSNRAGILRVATGGRYTHNLVWGNSTNYAGTAVAATTDLSVDPLFMNAAAGDFTLRAGSPVIDRGVPTAVEYDFSGLSRLEGLRPDMGAHEWREPDPAVQLVISEVMANPVDENRGEFVEIYNAGEAPVDLAGAILSDGDARDVLVARAGGSTVVAPGAYAVVLDTDYVDGYSIPTGVTTLNPGNTTVGNGLSTSDPITLYAADGVTVLAAAAFPFDPGNGVSAERVDLAAADAPTNWRASPCLQSAGRPNCAPVTLANGLVISEVMSNPLDEALGEFIELYNGSDTPIDAAGMTISDGAASDTIVGRGGGTTMIPARGYAVVLDRDWPDTQLFQIDPSAVLLTVGDAALGNGLSMSDPVTLRSASGAGVDSYTQTLQVANGRSVEKVSLSAGDALGNWAQSSCAEGSSPGRLNCVSGATAGPRKPLALTEVMSNPVDEDTGEFVEIFNRGVDPVDATGLLLSDGDAIDRIVGYMGGSAIIPGGGYAVILDVEHAGEYDIPPSAVLLATEDTSVGSGLAIDDPIRLLEANGVEVIDTFRFPFNPGNGISAERIDLRAFDSQANWTASTCVTGSSPGADNCSASAAGLPKRVRLTEVLADQSGIETGGGGEFVELLNTGALSVDLAGMYLESGPVGGTVARDRLASYMGGSTVLAPGAYAVVIDPDYDSRFTFPAGTVIVTISDTNFGSAGLATTHGVALYDADGITLLDAFRFPSNPGDGTSQYRVSLTVVDSLANWPATACGSTPGVGSCGNPGEVASYVSFWVDYDGSEAGHFWHQAIGWPSFYQASCDQLIVCPGGAYPYEYRDNVSAPSAFSFTNPYSDRPVTFVERSSPTDACTEPCPNASFTVDPGQTATVPASSLGYYYVEAGGPRLNGLSWSGGDPALYWSIPPDGILAPFSVEVF